MLSPFQSIPSYRKRNQYLLVGALLVLLLIYWISLRPTIALYGQHTQLRKEEKRAALAPQQIANYQEQLAGLKSGTAQPFQREQLLEKVTAFCREHQLLITSFPEAGKQIQSNYAVLTHEIEVEGAYKAMVKLVYMLEQIEVMGVVSSLKFTTHKDRRSKQKILKAKLILRNLET
ncbi:MAG: hypothetical protein AAF985_24050 [Bacteroidota bacterium]